MKPSYIVLGCLFIFLPFIVLYFRVTGIEKQNAEQTNQVSINTPLYEGADGYEDLPESVRKAAQEEGAILLTLSRGRITFYDQNTNTLTLLAENKTGAGMETREETVSLSRIVQVKCWPQSMPAQGGTVDITKAYIPLLPDKDLYLKAETIKPFEEVRNSLTPNTYVFVKKTLPNSNQSFEAQQLAVIGC